MSTQLGQSRWPVDLVLEGGGVKGIALAGALAVLEERGYEPRSLAGASAGAIAATLYAAGYSAEELHRELAQIPFQDFLDESLADRIPLIGKGASVLFDHGVYEGEAFLEWMRTMHARKGVSTFGELKGGGRTGTACRSSPRTSPPGAYSCFRATRICSASSPSGSSWHGRSG